MKWLQSATQDLFESVLENVKKDRPPFLSKSQLSALSDRAILSVALVSNREIRKLNKQWREKDYPTDVLSFTLDLDGDMAGLPFEIGELIISAEKAAEQASEYGHSLEREISFLFVHGCLHVLGFDHMSKAEENEMFGRQKIILENCGYPR